MISYGQALKVLITSAVLSLGFSPCAFAADAADGSVIETSPADLTEAQLLNKNQPAGRPIIGLTLGGGGARGGAHIGVLKVLEREGIKFDYVVGTSIGAVAGGFYCAGVPIEDMKKEFESGAVMRHFMTIPLWLRLVAAPVIIIPRLLGSHDYDGLYKGAAFRKYLANGLPADERNIEDLKIPFGAVTLNLLDGNPYIIRKGNLGKALQASCAVPALRKPVEIGNYLLCDGGVENNLPVKQCRQMGANFVIAVNIDETFTVAKKEAFRKVGSVSKRMIKWGLYETDLPQEQMADFVIHPNVDGISLISTKKSDAKRSVAAGEAAALKALPALREKLAQLSLR